MLVCASVRPVARVSCARKGIAYVNTRALDGAIDVRYQKDPTTGSGALVYSTRIEIGGMVSALESLFFNYQGKHYEFFDIELMGWKRYNKKEEGKGRKRGGVYVYYISFERMRQVPMHVFDREREVSAGAVD